MTLKIVINEGQLMVSELQHFDISINQIEHFIKHVWATLTSKIDADFVSIFNVQIT